MKRCLTALEDSAPPAIWNRSFRGAAFLTLILSVGIWLGDLKGLLGPTPWLLYIAPLWLCSRARQAKGALAFAGLATFLIVAVSFYSPGKITEASDLIGRLLGALVIWVVAILLECHTQHEQRLRERQEGMRLLFDQHPQPMWVYDEETLSVLAVNEAAIRKYGYSREEFLSLTIKDLRPPEDVPALLTGIAEKVYAEAQPGKIWRHRKKDGTVFGAEITSEEIVFEGRPARLVLINDVSEHQRLETELRNSEAHYHSLVENLPQNIFRKDMAGRFTYANGRFCQTLGKSAAEIVGKTDFDFFPEALAEKYRRDDLHVIQSGRPLEAVEEHQATDGTILFVQVVKTPVLDAQGRVQGIQAIFWDTTERKRAEERIQQQAELLDLVPDAIMVMDLKGEVRFWNRGAERLFGWPSREGNHTRNASELFEQNVAAFENAKQLVLDKGEWTAELRRRSKDEREMIVNHRWIALRDARNNPKEILAVLSDLTERKGLEAQFLRAQRVEAIGRLASGVAHDLNNIFTPVLLSLQMLIQSAEAETSKNLLRRIEKSLQRAVDIVKQMLTFGRGTSGERLAVHPEQLVEEMVKIMRETFQKNIRITTKLPDALWLVNGDPTQLHQVLLNLCLNAQDSMPEGGVLSLDVENVPVFQPQMCGDREVAPGSFVRLRVADTGMGIKPEILEKIFDPFFTTKEPGKGTGLGLSTVLGIVKGHGGFLKVQSRVKEGTVFEVYLPAQTTGALRETVDANVKLPRGHGETILLVDDEAEIRNATKTTLESYGYQVETAQDGVEAVAKYVEGQRRIDLVLTDFTMPSMDGVTLARTLKRMNCRAGIIGSSGLGSSNAVLSKTKAMQGLGVRTFLQKPYAMENLLRTVREVLDDKEKKLSA